MRWQLLGGDRAPQLVEDGGRVPADLALGSLEVLRPQPQPRRACNLLVVGDDVHLGVVEQRVGVEVGRSDREPAVVHDADLGVDVDDVQQLLLARIHRAGEEAVVALVGLDQGRHLPARDVGAVVGARAGRSTTIRKSSRGG